LRYNRGVRLLPLLLASSALVACAPSPQAPPAAAPAPAQPTYAPPPGTYPTQPTYPAQPSYPYPAPTTAPTPPAAAPSRPLLAPLVGSLALQAETRAVIAEDVAALTPDNQARVQGIPLVFDPNPYEINAYAACDPQGHPGIVGTEGLLEAIDAIAQTKATDELYGTQTYGQYLAAVIPALASSDHASAALPPNILPPAAQQDPRRWSRAHEWFDEIVAFTFGHELSHHWLGHTGCANGMPNLIGVVQSFLTQVPIPSFTQPAEFQADTEGTNTMLAAGRARVPQYRWNEEGGLALLDFFLHLEQSMGLGNQVKVAFLGTHPSSALRIPVVGGTARLWYSQHPG
jgi:hypothetical protein